MNKVRVYNSPLIKELFDEITPAEFVITEKRMLLAARLDEAIKAKGLRKNEFAKTIGKKPSEISKWLSGTHNFTTDTLFDIERVLNINLIRLESKPEITIKTYFVSVSASTSYVQTENWIATVIDKPYKSSFKAKGHIHSNN
jgi:transcriptional regulator with XRE-family HTH domain